MILRLLRRPAPAVRALSLLLSLGLAGFALYDAFQAKAPVGGLPPFPHYDKVLHFGAYFALATLSCHGFALFPIWRKAMQGPKGIFTVAFLVTLFGAGCEIVQGSMDIGRVGDPLDALANGLGAFLACLLFLWIQSVQYPKESGPEATTNQELL